MDPRKMAKIIMALAIALALCTALMGFVVGRYF